MAQLSKALVQSFRKNELLIGSGWRAYFAPFNQALAQTTSVTTTGPSILDLAFSGPFSTITPPSGWYDLGWIKDFAISPESKIGEIRSGYRGAVRAQYRGQAGETFEFKFREATRMAFKIATGSSTMNLLAANPAASTAGPLSGSGTQAVPLMASGYQANGAGTTAGSPTLFVPTSSGTLFSVGNFIVCDIDYDLVSFGLVGDAGQPIFQGAVVDVDYIRKTSDYVARIVSIVPGAVAGGDGLVLSGPLVGGGNGVPTASVSPPNTAKIQKIKGWVEREGGTAITEWSALFILDTIDSAQIAIYYPHVSISQFKGITEYAIENKGTTDLTAYELPCTLQALAFDDPLDGETVVGYKAFYQRPKADVAI